MLLESLQPWSLSTTTEKKKKGKEYLTYTGKGIYSPEQKGHKKSQC